MAWGGAGEDEGGAPHVRATFVAALTLLIAGALGCSGGSGTGQAAGAGGGGEGGLGGRGGTASSLPDGGGDAPAPVDGADGPASNDGGTGDDAVGDGPVNDAPASDAPASDAPPDGASDGQVASPPPYPYLVSGTRLRATTIVAADGPRFQTGFHDTQIGADCGFRNDTGRVVRCLPFTDGEVVFADSGCTTPVFPVDACNQRGWAWLSKSGGEDVYKVGASVAAPAAVWRLVNGADCVADAQPPASSAFASVEAWPASSFVAATVLVETRPSWRLGARYYVGEDGSKLRIGFQDAELGAECTIVAAHGGGRRCLSFANFPSVGTLLWADDRCTVPVARGGIQPSRYVRAFRMAPPSAPTCSATSYSVHEVLAEYQGNVWAEGSGGTCAATSPPNTALHLLGPDIAGAMLVELNNEVRPGGGTRLGMLRTRGSDGALFEPGGNAQLFDTHFNELCSFTVVSGGSLRCLPNVGRPSAGYADAACQIPAYYFAGGACTLPGAVDVHRTSSIDDACLRPVADGVRERGAQATSLFEGDSATCAPRNVAISNGYYVDAAAVALSEFVAGETGRE